MNNDFSDRVAQLEADDVNVNSTERQLSVLGGSALVLHGLTRGSFGGVVEALIGGALVHRGITGHCAVYGSMGVSTAEGSGAASSLPRQNTVHVQHSFLVNRPASELYDHWRQLENLPRFMDHLEQVEVRSDGRSHWKAKGPAGTHFEWDAEITEDVPNERIAWRSLPGSDVANQGSVSFRPNHDRGGTEVQVSLQYAPPAGALGRQFARLFGENPDHQVKEDLRRFKQLMEAGEVPTTAGQPQGS